MPRGEGLAYLGKKKKEKRDVGPGRRRTGSGAPGSRAWPGTLSEPFFFWLPSPPLLASVLPIFQPRNPDALKAGEKCLKCLIHPV